MTQARSQRGGLRAKHTPPPPPHPEIFERHMGEEQKKKKISSLNSSTKKSRLQGVSSTKDYWQYVTDTFSRI